MIVSHLAALFLPPVRRLQYMTVAHIALLVKRDQLTFMEYPVVRYLQDQSASAYTSEHVHDENCLPGYEQTTETIVPDWTPGGQYL